MEVALDGTSSPTYDRSNRFQAVHSHDLKVKAPTRTGRGFAPGPSALLTVGNAVFEPDSLP